VDEPEVPHAVHSAQPTTVVAASAARGARAAAPGPKVSLFDDDSKDVLGGDRDLQNVFIPQEAVEQVHAVLYCVLGTYVPVQNTRRACSV